MHCDRDDRHRGRRPPRPAARAATLRARAGRARRLPGRGWLRHGARRRQRRGDDTARQPHADALRESSPRPTAARSPCRSTTARPPAPTSRSPTGSSRRAPVPRREPSCRSRAAPGTRRPDRCPTRRGASQAGYAPMYGALLEHWNMLAVDNRGTGASTPLRCTPLQSFAGATGTSAFQKIVGECGAALNRRWHYPDRTAVHASDLFTTAPRRAGHGGGTAGARHRQDRPLRGLLRVVLRAGLRRALPDAACAA